MQLKRYQENWLLYRSTEESLKREKFLFLNNAGNYSNLDNDIKNRTLVESVEAVLLSETLVFFQCTNQNYKQSHLNDADDCINFLNWAFYML